MGGGAAAGASSAEQGCWSGRWSGVRPRALHTGGLGSAEVQTREILGSRENTTYQFGEIGKRVCFDLSWRRD